ncbi:TPA: ribosome-associated translation inhibitor RaiA [Candidatus Dependentiae bacterium]|nr:MAG: hypothetical protein UR14_C0004G0004 [candidate division TM6 bacterium GW2011_GWE2_31_21]KKP52922.1 MAG: hypothetical protein UR43_C0008G0004 [candidate division TM6 bacterium GW2011_GWF2_33_332]HBS47837.1 ribosome-associated translation inhibitor RaiA [Candidatus Dependentiae bacterium]HBZ73187.1 ribosome-associated translation inhibitor RaiA [Candidatus Dependentiae bacterium]
MNKKITFQNMESTKALELHAEDKLEKILEILKIDKMPTPVNLEIWLKAQKLHPNHVAEIHLKTPRFDLYSHESGKDMYVAIDCAVDKIILLYKKAKEKESDKKHKVETEKKAFSDDKYTLGD